MHSLTQGPSPLLARLPHSRPGAGANGAPKTRAPDAVQDDIIVFLTVLTIQTIVHCSGQAPSQKAGRGSGSSFGIDHRQPTPCR